MSSKLIWVLVLAAAGLANATYASLVYYGLIKAGRLAGADACEPSECTTVMHTPWGRLFGLPNSVWGIGFYLAIILMTVGRVAIAGLPADGNAVAGISGAAGAAAGGTAMTGGLAEMLTLMSLLCAAAVSIYGAWLIWVLVFRLGRPCPICYMAHSLNLILLIMLLASAT